MVSAPAPASAPERAPTTGTRSPDTRAAAPVEADPGTPSFGLRLAGVVRQIALAGEHVRSTRRGYEIGLAPLNLSIPGVRFTRLELRKRADGTPAGGTLHGAVRAPFVTGDVRLNVDANGDLSGGARLNTSVGLLGNPVVSFQYEGQAWSGALEVAGSDMRLPIPRVQMDEGRARIEYTGEQLSGSLTATFHHGTLGEGDINVTITNETVEGGGGFTLSVPMLNGSRGTFDYSGGDLSATLELSANGIEAPIPGLSVNRANGTLTLVGGRISGSAGLEAEYAGLALLTLDDIQFRDSGFAGGSGTIRVTAPPIDGIEGTAGLTPQGRPHGRLTIPQGDIPIPALSRGRITITLREDGGVDLTGSGTISIGPGSGDLRIGWEDGVLSLGADVTLSVPPLDQVTGSFEYRGGQLQGEVGADVTVGALSGNVMLRYRDEQFSGEGRLAYEMGRFEGWVLLVVDPESRISGEGEATVRLTDSLIGTIGLAIDPELNVDARGELVFANEITLFRAWEYERNFFSYEQEFPLWGITIPVVGSIGLVAEVGASAGFRANFGPGVFRNIRAEGEVSTRPDVEPTFSISGDIYIPAGAEIVLALNGGVALAALVAKLSGGIEIQGIAGIYGALTLTPTFQYADGDYTIRGDALLEAAAQLAARVNAYARVKAGIGWLSKEVWRENWNLAEWRFDTGWSVGVRAGIAYTLGEPFEPEISFEPVEVDPQALARAAVPKSGEPVAAPPSPPAAEASFVPAEGQVEAVSEPAEGADAPAGAEGVPPGGAPPGPAVDGEEPAEPEVGPPVAISEPADERSIAEAYLVYRYDQLRHGLQRKAQPGAPSPEDLEHRANAREPDEAPPVPSVAESPGRPLSPQQRARMEAIFGEDFTDVRVHDDPAARESAEQVAAEAFTVGDHVFLGAGHPSAEGEDPLLAHELAHVVQRAGGAAGAEGVSSPEDDLEREAEEAAEAVKRGEQPRRIRGRHGDAAIHRQPPDGGGEDGGGKKRTPEPLTEERWNEIVRRFGDDPVIGRVIRNLSARGDFAELMANHLYSEEQHLITIRPFVPMHWPPATHLAHRNVFGQQLIAPRDILVRHQGEREDAGAQSELAGLIRDEAAFPVHEIGVRELPEPSDAWRAYQQHPRRREALADGEPEQATFAIRPGQKTSESLHNLTLNSTAFGRLWGAGYTYVPRSTTDAQGNAVTEGRWELTHPGGRSAAAASGAAPDADSVRRFTQDYHAHHVVPLWLRSGSGRPDGDQMQNLVPWFHGAHQSNHAAQQRTPPAVEEATGVSNYLRFPGDTQFRIHEIGGGSQPHPAGSAVPQLNLVREGGRYRWQPGTPLWAP